MPNQFYGAGGATLVEPEIESSIDEALTEPADETLGAVSQGRGTKRIELRANQSFVDAIDLLANDEGLTRADIIRRAVGLYARARIEQKKGRHLAFAELEGSQLSVKQLVKI